MTEEAPTKSGASDDDGVDSFISTVDSFNLTIEGATFTDSDDEMLSVVDPDHYALKRYQEALKTQFLADIDTLKDKLRETRLRNEKSLQYENVLEKELKLVENGISIEKSNLKKVMGNIDCLEKAKLEQQKKLKHVRSVVNTAENANKKRREDLKVWDTILPKLNEELFRLKILLEYHESQKQALKKQVMTNINVKAGKENLALKLLTKKMEEDISRVNLRIEDIENWTLDLERKYSDIIKRLKTFKMELDSTIVYNRQLRITWKTEINSLRLKKEKISELQRQLGTIENDSMNQDERIEKLEDEIKIVVKESNNISIETNISLKRCKNFKNNYSKGQDKVVDMKSELKREIEGLNCLLEKKDVLNQELKGLKKITEKESMKLLEIETSKNGLESKLILDTKLIDYDQLNIRNESKYLEELKTNGISYELECSRLENIYTRLQLQFENDSERKKLLDKDLLEAKKEEEEIAKHYEDLKKIYSMHVKMLESKQSELERKRRKYEELKLKIEEKKEGDGPKRVLVLKEELEYVGNDCKKLQEAWLSLQNHIIKIESDKENILNNRLDCEERIRTLDQKRILSNRLLEEKRKECLELYRNTGGLHDNLKIINNLLSSDDENKELSLVAFEKELLEKLDTLERIVTKLQDVIHQCEEEKNEHKAQIFESERLRKLWSMKLKEALNLRHTVFFEKGDCSELAILKECIHRLELEKTKLVKAIEELSRILEKAVNQRACLVEASDLRKGRPDPSLKAKAKLLKCEVKKLLISIGKSDREIESFQLKHSDLRTVTEAKREELMLNSSRKEDMTSSIKQMTNLKNRQVRMLSVLQRRQKQLSDALLSTVTREFPKSDDIRSDTYQPSDATIEKLAKASTEVSHLANRVGTAIRENPNMAQWLKPILELLLEQY
ncbi:coiled-coil domain-containing protein 40-like [Artemia franciscana]|uniref:Uncharacterized protein n=1 Tax=Artemia franciscana TaxID=6661 RepID=A0AA88LHI6_ARTSF|nr:hypothetical protein QYM36_007870 [Artemia franciscana]